MIGVAIFFDGLQAAIQTIPILGQILSGFVAIFAFLTFWLWFKLHGVKLATGKRAASMGLGFIFELIPFLNILPAWTLAVTLTAFDTKVKNLSPHSDKSGDNDSKNQKAA